MTGWTAALQRARRPAYREERLGDFRITTRLVPIALLATVLGVVSAFLALGLLRLIGLFTNLFFYQRISTDLVSAANNTLGLWVIAVPVIGGLIVGFMARYGSDRIRGHGIPEAIEAILINGSKVQPRVAILKPLSSAIAIGSGGPFGAEGPIIVTGGAIGSLLGQNLRLTSAERKTLLVAGAAGGMSATFAAPVAAALLAVELLLFEWRPRSLIPIALASGAAAVVRQFLLGSGPLFPVPQHATVLDVPGFFGCVIAGLAGGALAVVLTWAVYGAEDAFRRLPIHWMWWPAIGGVVIGIGGIIFPQALGVGYDTIGDLLQGDVANHIILGVLIVKAVIWAIALGSGTSGGVLAPLLMIGASLGGVESFILPNEGVGFWPLVSMAATFGGTMRAPLTAIVFTIELTHDVTSLLPLLIAVSVSYGVTVLAMKRSILTEKVSRRGYHLTSEYAPDPLERYTVRQVLPANAVTVLPSLTIQDALARVVAKESRRQRLIPVVDGEGALQGVVTRRTLSALARESSGSRAVSEVMEPQPVVAGPNETLRDVAQRIARTGRTCLPVVEGDERRVVGLIALPDLLEARRRVGDEEVTREQVLHMLLPRRATSPRRAAEQPARTRQPAATSPQRDTPPEQTGPGAV